MTRKDNRLAWGIVRETAFAFGWWLAALIVLFVLATLSFAELGVVALVTSPVQGRLLAPLGWTLLLLATTTIVWAVLAVPVLGLVSLLEGTVAQPLATAPAYLASSVPPFLWVTVYLVGAFTGILPSPGGWSDGLLGKVGILLILGTLIAIPFVAIAARRFRLWLTARRAAGEDAGLLDGLGVLGVLGGDGLRLGSTEAWMYAAYLVGSLAVVEAMIGYPGLGQVWIGAILDFRLFFGAAALFVLLFVVAGYARNLAWVAGTVRSDRGVDATDDAGTEAGRERAAADGGLHDGLSTGGTTGPSASAVLKTVLTRPKVLVGGGGFALVAIVGLVGSRLLAVERSGIALEAGVGPGVVANSLGDVVLFALVAAGIAALLGIPLGVLAGLAESRDAPVPGAVATALRALFDVPLVAPLVVVGGVVLAMFGPTFTNLVLTVGGVGGLALAAWVLRATQVGTSARLRADPDRGIADVLPAATVGTLARTASYVAVVWFVAAELVVLEVAATETLPAIQTLVEHVLLSVTFGGRQIVVLASALLVVGLPALCLALLADGLREAEIAIDGR